METNSGAFRLYDADSGTYHWVDLGPVMWSLSFSLSICKMGIIDLTLPRHSENPVMSVGLLSDHSVNGG